MSSETKGGTGLFSCVLDEHPRFHLDALRWFACLTEVAGVHPDDLVAHVVGDPQSDVLDFLKGHGVAVVEVAPFDKRSPHCNKISGALRLAEENRNGTVVLCDTDLAVLEDPRTIELPEGSIGAKPVDAPVPPLPILGEVFAEAGLPAPRTIELAWGSDDLTLSGNNNGGLYLVPGSLLPGLATAWAQWARWLLDRIALLGQWRIYIDQVAMALALRAEGIDSTALAVRWNTPTHDASRIRADAAEPAIIHYHQEVDRAGLLKDTSSPSINKGIAKANEAIARVWEEAGPGRTQQQWLAGLDAAMVPAEAVDPFRAIASVLLGALGPSTVLVLGEPGQELTTGLVNATSTRSGPSLEALGRAVQDGAGDRLPTADLVISIGTLPAPTGREEHESLIRLLCDAAARALLVSGWEGAGEKQENLDEPLVDTLRRMVPGAEVYPVGHPQSGTFVVLKEPPDRHPRDFSAVTLDPLVGRHPDPLALATLRLHARETTGFYPDHAPRLWEYPVAADLIARGLPAGSRLVDVGAGVTPLAPFLTKLGFVIDTVDPSPNRRTWPPQPDWNEWHFLDYADAGLAHRSWNCTLDKLPLRPPFDGAYSISVIEHIPAKARRALLGDISSRVRADGLVVLTIDLFRGEERLWNRNLGIEVETPAVHGTLADVIDECAKEGLAIIRQEIVRDWGSTDVDIGLLALRQTRVPPATRGRGAIRGTLTRLRGRSN